MPARNPIGANLWLTDIIAAALREDITELDAALSHLNESDVLNLGRFLKLIANAGTRRRHALTPPTVTTAITPEWEPLGYTDTGGLISIAPPGTPPPGHPL